MQYTRFGNTGLRVSRFGLGCMRFPEDEKDAIEMVRYAIDHGVNYVDTAYSYENSEAITGKALKDGYRERTVLATKSPVWLVEKHADFEKYLDEELRRLKTDRIDVYLLHNLSHTHWEQVKRFDGLSFLDKMVEKGKILFKAFSIHNTLPAFMQIVDACDWDMAQIQLNILDEKQQAGIGGLKYGAAKGLAMVVMEPLRGGNLLNAVPKEVRDLLARHPEKRSLVEWCFRWLYDKPEVSVILSGTRTLEQLKDNLRIFDRARPGVMSGDDQRLIAAIRAAFEAQHSIGCTGCGYCMPCPSGVRIPEVFRLYNSHQLMKPGSIDTVFYKKSIVPINAGADQCIACGECAGRCPQSLDIPQLLKLAHAGLTEE
ncbi:MAG: aldo/keto reductase [Christensenellales bacterium]|jgi:predicted aldo/keto reductase-like oxidoreductase